MSDAEELVQQLYDEAGDRQSSQICEAIFDGNARESVYLTLEWVDSQLELSGFYDLIAEELPHNISSAILGLWILRRMAEDGVIP